MKHTTKAAWLLTACGLLAGCASTPSPLPRLQEARVILERARSVNSPAATAQIADAEGAIEYAETEYKVTPNHPLGAARAENALAKARLAYQLAASSSAPAPVNVTATTNVSATTAHSIR